MTEARREPDPLYAEYGPPIGTEPAGYSDDLAVEICTRMALGESVKAICLSPGMPARRTVYRWLANNPVFVQMYCRAQALRCEGQADELVELCDSLDHCEDLTNEKVQLLRVKIDTRKWAAARLLSGRYGDRLEVNATADAPLASSEPLNVLEVARRVAFVLALGDPGAGSPPEPVQAPKPEPLRLGLTPERRYAERVEAAAVAGHPGRVLDAEVLAAHIQKGGRIVDLEPENQGDYRADLFLAGQAGREEGRTRGPKRPRMVPSSRRPLTWRDG